MANFTLKIFEPLITYFNILSIECANLDFDSCAVKNKFLNDLDKNKCIAGASNDDNINQQFKNAVLNYARYLKHYDISVSNASILGLLTSSIEQKVNNYFLKSTVKGQNPTIVSVKKPIYDIDDYHSKELFDKCTLSDYESQTFVFGENKSNVKNLATVLSINKDYLNQMLENMINEIYQQYKEKELKNIDPKILYSKINANFVPTGIKINELYEHNDKYFINYSVGQIIDLFKKNITTVINSNFNMPYRTGDHPIVKDFFVELREHTLVKNDISPVQNLLLNSFEIIDNNGQKYNLSLDNTDLSLLDDSNLSNLRINIKKDNLISKTLPPSLRKEFNTILSDVSNIDLSTYNKHIINFNDGCVKSSTISGANSISSSSSTDNADDDVDPTDPVYNHQITKYGVTPKDTMHEINLAISTRQSTKLPKQILGQQLSGQQIDDQIRILKQQITNIKSSTATTSPGITTKDKKLQELYKNLDELNEKFMKNKKTHTPPYFLHTTAGPIDVMWTELLNRYAKSIGKPPKTDTKNEYEYVAEEDSIDNKVKENNWIFKSGKYYTKIDDKETELNEAFVLDSMKDQKKCLNTYAFDQTDTCIKFLTGVMENDLSSVKSLINDKYFALNIHNLSSNIDKVDPIIVFNVLKTFGFKKISILDLSGEKMNIVENYERWKNRIEKTDSSLANSLNTSSNLKMFLQLLITYINKNETILNPNRTLKNKPALKDYTEEEIIPARLRSKGLRIAKPRSSTMSNNTWEKLLNDMNKTYGKFYKGFNPGDLSKIPHGLTSGTMIPFLESLVNKNMYTYFGKGGFTGKLDESFESLEVDGDSVQINHEYAKTINTLWKRLKEKLKKYNKSLSEEEEGKINKEIAMIDQLESQLYETMTKLQKYSALLQIFDNKNTDSNLSLDKIGSLTKKYNNYSNNFDTKYGAITNLIHIISNVIEEEDPTLLETDL